MNSTGKSHILSNVNSGERTASCTVCGHTKVRKRSDNQRWRCVTAEKAIKYGLEPGQYNSLVKKQHARCAICEKVMLSPNIDHDHKTGEVRGLLCSNCNTGIGLLGDSTDRLLRAILYLDKHWTDRA